MFKNLGRVGYIIILVLILGAVYLSQQPFAGSYGEALWQKTADWVSSYLAPKISGEVTSGGASIFKAATDILKK
jgi:hypothetical protein